MPAGRPLAEPSDDPKINERRRKAREQARDRASTAKQLKVKGIGARESVERKSRVMKELECDEQLKIVKKELKRKQAQIKFLAENINNVDASSSSIKGSSSSVKVDKKKIDTLTAKVDDIVGEDIDAVDTMSKMMKRVLAKKQVDKMKDDAKNENAGGVLSAMIKRKQGKTNAENRIKQLDKLDIQNNMATKIQAKIRARQARLVLAGKKFVKSNEAKYKKKVSDEKRARNAPYKVMTDEERAKRDAIFAKKF
jgi:hypothetical protein